MHDTAMASFALCERTGYDHDDYPLVAGVPIARGVIRDPSAIAVRSSAGARIDASTEAAARWADGSVKWLLLTAPRLTIGGGTRDTLTLEAAEPRERSGDHGSATVEVTEANGGRHIDTGRLRFTIQSSGPLVPSIESRIDGTWRDRGRNLDSTVSIMRSGNERRYSAGAGPRQVEIESASPYRVVVAVRGTHASEDGATFGPYILRFECLAGSPQLRLTHSLVFDGDPETDRLGASEICFEAKVGEEQAFAFGGDEGRENRFPRQRAHFTPDFRFAELYQDSVTHWRLERWVNLDNRAVFCDEGQHCDGWMELSGSDGRVAVAVREGWQNHPKSWFADADSGEIRIGLYARRAEPLNLRRYSDQVYNHTYECPSFKQMKQGKEPPYSPEPRKAEFNAHGFRKTHSVALLFDEPNPSRATLFYNQPLRLTWPPSYTQETRVVVPAATGLTPDAHRKTCAFLEFLKREMVRSGGTGYLDYFDLPLGFDLASQRWLHDYGGLGYINNEGMPNLGFWHVWLLTGRHDALEMGAAMARHNIDIDSVHLGQFAGKGCRHNVTHWADQNREPRISQPQGTRFYGYISGDRSYLDMVPLMLDLWRRDYAEPRPMSTYGYVPSCISSLLTADEAGIEDCSAWLAQCADALAAGIDQRGVMTSAFLCDATRQRLEPVLDAKPESNLLMCHFGGMQTFMELAERYDHQPLRDALVRHAYYQSLPRAERVAVESGHDWKEITSIQQDSINTFSSLDLLGYAYQQTGDDHFRDALKHLHGQLMVRLEVHDETRYGKPGASTREVPVGHVYPDVPQERLDIRRKHFPLFDFDVTIQHKLMAFWMQKLQGAGVLGVLDDAAQPQNPTNPTV